MQASTGFPASGHDEPMTQNLKRFYKQADIKRGEADGHWHVVLDDRPVRTPGRALQAVPSQALAEAMAEEWNSQLEDVDIAGMHLTRLANVAIDRAPATRGELAAELGRYCQTDLVCHLAPEGSQLRQRQDAQWGPLRHWAGKKRGIMLVPVEGVIASPQPSQSIAAAIDYARALDDFRLTGLAFGCALFGSGVLAIATEQHRIDGLEAYGLSQLEADYQSEQWGVDEEAAKLQAAQRLEAAALGAWFETLKDRPQGSLA